MGGDASESDGGDVLAGIDVEAGTWHTELMGVVAGALGAVCGEEFGCLTAEEFGGSFPLWVKRMLRLKPSHFQNPANCLFTTSDGKVLSSGKMAQALKSAAGRLGLREEEVNAVSLRSGGATAMYHAGFSVGAIQRRGRWASGCWKIYVQDAHDTARDVAERMAAASVTLL